jgi:hypothetical protein
MKHLFYFLILVIPKFGMTQVTDNFSDGNFTANPVWSSDTSQFEVNSAKQLHLRSSGADTSVLVVQNSSVKNTEWDLWLKLSFNTSSNNNARVYLVSDHPDLKNSLNGYYLQVGGTNDSVQFMKQTGNLHQKLFTGAISYTGNSTNILRIKVIHDSSGVWHLFSDPTGDLNFTEEGSIKEISLAQTSWFGFYCKYTSSNATRFYFDDVYIGPVIIDSVAPSIKSIEVVSGDKLDVSFSEAIEISDGEDKSNYWVSGHGAPVSATADPDDPKLFHLLFENHFDNGSCDTLLVHEISDLNGNRAKDLKSSFCIYEEKAFDVVINEIMADPDPQVGLPEAEYIELFNRTSFPIRLRNWILEFSSSRKTLPDVTIAPSGYLSLTKGDWLGFFGASVDLFTSSFSLTNDGTTLVLKNDNDKIIHSVTYSIEWYCNSLKENGGWSLEMKDPANPCGCGDNWTASNNQLGGTPGSENSVFQSHPDILKPYMKRAFIESEDRVRVIFSEPMDSVSFPGPGQWLIEEEKAVIDSVTLVPPEYSEVILYLSDPIGQGAYYTLFPPSGVIDCSGNPVDTTRSMQFALPDTLSPLDIVINEILSNPTTGGERFIEIYNRSEKIQDLKNLVLSNADSSSGGSFSPLNITEEGFLFFPGHFLVLTKNPDDIQSRYFTSDPDAFLRMSSMPSMNDETGTIILSRKNDLKVIDRVDYSKEMQFSLLTSTDGVSMERIDVSGPSQNTGNWHSAAESCGFATPGYKNSQSMIQGTSENAVTVTPEVFSPDNDGREDLLIIQFNLDKPGYMANAAVYDDHGRLTKYLVRNEMLAPEGFFSWDGTTDENKKASIGIYIIWIGLFSPDGTVRQFKKAAVLGSRF